MKQLLENGSVWITGSAERGRHSIPQFQPVLHSHKFDPWPEHAAGDPVNYSAWNRAGQFVVVFQVPLVDGSNWYYLFPARMSYSQWLAWHTYFVNWKPLGYNGTAFGEAFNYLARPTVFAKLTLEEFHAEWTVI